MIPRRIWKLSSIELALECIAKKVESLACTDRVFFFKTESTDRLLADCRVHGRLAQAVACCFSALPPKGNSGWLITAQRTFSCGRTQTAKVLNHFRYQCFGLE